MAGPLHQPKFLIHQKQYLIPSNIWFYDPNNTWFRTTHVAIVWSKAQKSAFHRSVFQSAVLTTERICAAASDNYSGPATENACAASTRHSSKILNWITIKNKLWKEFTAATRSIFHKEWLLYSMLYSRNKICKTLDLRFRPRISDSALFAFYLFIF